ncbi:MULTISPECIES: hypothetical protein [unclassified Myxococcus]|uniref:hypothetical protein n=1 Tax=unclassified Myxococcus TaxID=2648731 RepID=UPI001891795A|nr:MULTISPECIES: hypothetical protein [unclassified Myxococcus]
MDTSKPQKTETSAGPNAPRPTPAQGLGAQRQHDSRRARVAAAPGLLGHAPGNNRNLRMFDQGSDNQNCLQRMSGQPTPIGKLLNDLDG